MSSTNKFIKKLESDSSKEVSEILSECSVLIQKYHTYLKYLHSICDPKVPMMSEIEKFIVQQDNQ